MSVTAATAAGNQRNSSSNSVVAVGINANNADPDPRLVSLVKEVIYADIPEKMQETIMNIAEAAIDKCVFAPTRSSKRECKKLLEREVERTQLTNIAKFIKETLDAELKPLWHVVFGRSFGTYVTHESMHFFHFKINGAEVICWKHGA